jgi:hypothetical protein
MAPAPPMLSTYPALPIESIEPTLLRFEMLPTLDMLPALL